MTEYATPRGSALVESTTEGVGEEPARPRPRRRRWGRVTGPGHGGACGTCARGRHRACDSAVPSRWPPIAGSGHASGRGVDRGGQGATYRPGAKLPLIVGGRSSGARVACRTAAAIGAAGVLALAFPLHPPGRPERSRDSELRTGVPTFVVNGDRDPFGVPEAGPDVRSRSAGAKHDLRTDLRGTAALVVDWLSRMGWTSEIKADRDRSGGISFYPLWSRSRSHGRKARNTPRRHTAAGCCGQIQPPRLPWSRRLVGGAEGTARPPVPAGGPGWRPPGGRRMACQTGCRSGMRTHSALQPLARTRVTRVIWLEGVRVPVARDLVQTTDRTFVAGFSTRPPGRLRWCSPPQSHDRPSDRAERHRRSLRVSSMRRSTTAFP